MQKPSSIYLKLLKTILWIYIILCILIAGMNYGYASKAPENISKIITWIWLIYENWIKTLFILIGSFLTFKIISSSKRTKMRKRNLIGFIIAALTVHVVTPLIFYNYELYFFAMPLPWTTTPLQLLDINSALYQSTVTSWGPNGILSALIFFRFPINGIAGSKISAANPLKRQMEEHWNLRPKSSVPIKTIILMQTKKIKADKIPLGPQEVTVLWYRAEFISSN